MARTMSDEESKAIQKRLKSIAKGMKNGTIDVYDMSQTLEIVDDWTGVSHHTGMTTLSITFFDPSIIERQMDDHDLIMRRLQGIMG